MKLGEKQTLYVINEVDFGVYLAEHPEHRTQTIPHGKQGSDEACVLLPAKQVPEGIRIGDPLVVFLYRDSDDRLIATTREPRLTVGSVAPLSVVQVTRIGAFLDWGLEKDLLLPFKEQLRKVSEGDEILVTLYVDKSGRLCATMRGLYTLLATGSPYRTGDIVTGRIYEFGRDFGTFVAVDDRYSAMIPRHEDTSALKIGDVISATVTNIKEDGKIDLTIREKSYLQTDTDAGEIMKLIERHNGTLPFNDKASPEVIMREAHMSKKAFKRAVGRLYRDRRIEITESGIRRLK